MRGQGRQVVTALAQRRHLQWHHVDAIEEVFAEFAALDQRFQRAVRGGDDSYIDGDQPCRADRLDFTVLQHAQQLGLHRQRHVADLIEKQRAAIRELELAGLAASPRAGERAFLIAEQLRLQQRFGNRRAVELDEGPLGTRRAAMQRMSIQLLASTGLATDQYRGAAGGDLAYLAGQLPHGGRIPDDVTQLPARAVGGFQRLTVVVHLRFQRLDLSIHLPPFPGVVIEHRADGADQLAIAEDGVTVGNHVVATNQLQLGQLRASAFQHLMHAGVLDHLADIAPQHLAGLDAEKLGIGGVQKLDTALGIHHHHPLLHRIHRGSQQLATRALDMNRGGR